MAGTPPVIVERADSRSPSEIGLAVDSGRASMLLKVRRTDPTRAHWEEVFTHVLGEVGSVGGTNGGKIRRVLPISHPDCSWMVASRIAGCKGIGRWALGTSEPVLEVPALPGFALYSTYEMNVEFIPMQYPYLPDDQIKVLDGTWYDDSGAVQHFRYVTEFDRYCWWQIEDNSELLEAKFGQQVFRTASTLPPNLVPFPGTVSARVPRAVVLFHWIGVPYRYVTSANSYIRSFKGHVNQKDFLGWKAGHLLYTDSKVRRYVPAVPGMFFDEEDVLKTYLGAVCDVTFVWELAERDAVDAPAPGNPNWIVHGHNTAMNFATRQWHYVTSMGDSLDPTTWVPPRRSRSFERLFTDPDQAPP